MSDFIKELQKKYKHISWSGKYRYFCGDQYTLIGKIGEIKFSYDGNWNFISILTPFYTTIDIPVLFGIKLKYEYLKMKNKMKHLSKKQNKEREVKRKNDEDLLKKYI